MSTMDAKLDRATKVLRALNIVGDDLVGQATDLVPLDEGTLQGSAAVVLIVDGVRHEGEGALAAATRHAHQVIRAGGTPFVQVEVSYNTVYAARQHEELDWEHDPGRQAKYLEEPFARNLNRYERVLAAAGRLD